MSLGAYARHRAAEGLPGATLKAVQVAIRDGRLATSLTAGGQKIRSAAAADAEWLANTKSDYVPLTGRTAPKGKGRAAKTADPPADLATSRARKEAALAALAEIELDEKRGKLIPARDVEARLADVFLNARTRLLGIPARAREADPTLSATQLQLVEDLVREALEELAA
jgi:hypothetical protein